MGDSQEEEMLILLILPHEEHTAICRALLLIGSPSNLNHIWFLIAFFLHFIIGKYNSCSLLFTKFFAHAVQYSTA